MFKQLVLLMLIIMIGSSSVAMASWAAFGACFTDPCNCGLEPQKRTEKHPTFTSDRRVKRHDLCPPWNKGGGRHNNTCLVLKNYPSTPSFVYKNLCAEATPDSTYFNPRIRVRGQQCNALACWTTNNTLDWDGDCVTLASGYGVFPLYRMCARIALPKDEKKGFEQDPGYTNGKHLDTTGAVQDDDVIIGIDGQEIKIESPKLCLYSDPAFMSVSDGLRGDYLDLDPNRQPMHLSPGTHPVIEVILFFINIAASSASSLSELIGSLINKIFGTDDQTTFGVVIKEIFSFVGFLLEVTDIFESVLREYGQINRAVDSTVYGCVNLPLGPMPPPFCERIAPFFQVAEVQDICETGSDGAPVQSLENKECHVSTVKNNYIRNSVRVGYEELVPLCKNGKDPNSTDKCIDIENIGAFTSAQGMHLATARRDIIKHCDSAVTGEPCVKSMIPHSCSVTSNGCQNGFRVVYGHNMGGIVTPKSYYQDDIPDCPSSGSAICQEIWGINKGEFQDISLTFPSEQTSYDISPIVSSFDLVDKGGRIAHFSSSIVRISTHYPNFGFRQEPNQICVFEGDFVVGCRARAQISKPNIYECGSSPNPSVTCTSNYFVPNFIVSYSSGADSTTAMIEPKSIHNPGGINNAINLAGNEFESFVTNDSFLTKPFSGANSPDASSLFGEYQDNIPPVSGTTVNNDAVYLSGLEYISGNYHLGGKYACLESYDYTKCPQNPKMCVLSKLLNKETVLCSTFFAKSSEHSGLNICLPSQSSGPNACPVVDSIPKKNNGSINIRSCAGGVKCYESSKELCQISFAPSDRVNPSASLGLVLSDNQYYDTSFTGSYPNAPPANASNYDENLYGVRDKTPVELGLCVAIPQGNCPAENTYNADTGFASWPSVAVGEYSYGTCKKGKVPQRFKRDLVRRCVANPDTKSFNLEPVYRIERNSPFYIPKKIYPTNIKCIDP